MKICILGRFSRELNEGAKNVTCVVSNELSRNHDVLRLDFRTPHKLSFWRALRAFQPDIIHCFGGASVKSLLLLRSARFFVGGSGKTKAVMSAVHPCFEDVLNSFVLSRLFAFLRPDLLLVQSHQIE